MPQTRRQMGYRAGEQCPDNGCAVNNHGWFGHAGTTGTEDTSGSRSGSGSDDGRGAGGWDGAAASGCVARAAGGRYRTRAGFSTRTTPCTAPRQCWTALVGRRGARARNCVPGGRRAVGHCRETRTHAAGNRGASGASGASHGGAADDQQQLHWIPSISRHRFATTVRWKRGSGAAAGRPPARHARMRSI
jgi:hypothetical protein